MIYTGSLGSYTQPWDTLDIFNDIGADSGNYQSIACDNNNNMFFSIFDGKIYKQINSTGNLIVTNSEIKLWKKLTKDSNGNIYGICSFPGEVWKKNYDSDTFIKISSALVNHVYDICIDINDNIFIIDNDSGGSIKKFNSSTGNFDYFYSFSNGYLCSNNEDLYAASVGLIENGIIKFSNYNTTPTSQTDLLYYWNKIINIDRDIYCSGALDEEHFLFKQTDSYSDFNIVTSIYNKLFSAIKVNNDLYFTTVEKGPYKQKNGIGDFVIQPITKTYSYWHCIEKNLNNEIYIVGNFKIYKKDFN